jgi:GntR family transcriptional regulator, transcriptional repressor for pyruvate dehydrogenase complex
MTVGRVNMNRVTEYLGFHPAIQNVSAEELIDTRVLIETSVLPHVAQRMKRDATIYERLNGINAEMSRAKSVTKFIHLDIAFHHELIHASGLSPLMAFTDLLAVFFQRFRENVKKGDWTLGFESHQRLIDLLKAGRVRESIRELRLHIESHRHR